MKNIARVLGLMAIAFAAGYVLRGSDAPAESVELAQAMGELQGHSHKLGLSIQAQNAQLTDFYLHELEEVLEDIAKVPEYDGFPIADLSRAMMTPLMDELEAGAKAGDWPRIEKGYHALIEGCNQCHVATDHGFIAMLPGTGPSPFNQQFEEVLDRE